MSVDPNPISERRRTVSKSEMKMKKDGEKLEKMAEIDDKILEKL